MKVTVLEHLDQVSASEWNALGGGLHDPFLRHEFLANLERHGCVGERWGWVPKHLTVEDNGRLIGAVPLYLKYNSYGEFVFDWSWADAYRRAGISYYPKLVASVPYTPATGSRLLLAPERSEEVSAILISTALELARELEVSSLHWLFTTEQDTQRLTDAGLMRRTGCQFHWHNAGYRDFDDFLDTFTAEKRKKVKRERRRVRDAGVELDVLDGHQATAEHWSLFHQFYVSTFDKRGGHPTLTREFFESVAAALPDQVMLVMARYQGRYVAGALSFRSNDTLYGRHWGCDAEFHSLHFEACYYAGLDYCIQHGLQRFEPGAQGEHKVSRGFVPTPTWSAHWLANPVFSRAVGDYLEHEHAAMQDYMCELNEHAPYKSTA